jgi:hypothetical protein
MVRQTDGSSSRWTVQKAVVLREGSWRAVAINFFQQLLKNGSRRTAARDSPATCWARHDDVE